MSCGIRRSNSSTRSAISSSCRASRWENVNVSTADINSLKFKPRGRQLSRRVGRVMDWMHEMYERRVYRTMDLLRALGAW